jgi:hypothetical protein
MKKLYFIVMGLFAFQSAQAQLFSDNFDSYTVGQYLGPQSLTWSTWSGAEGGAEDAQQLNAGLYLVHVNINGNLTTLRWMVE